MNTYTYTHTCVYAYVTFISGVFTLFLPDESHIRLLPQSVVVNGNRIWGFAPSLTLSKITFFPCEVHTR